MLVVAHVYAAAMRVARRPSECFNPLRRLRHAVEEPLDGTTMSGASVLSSIIVHSTGFQLSSSLFFPGRGASSGEEVSLWRPGGGVALRRKCNVSGGIAALRRKCNVSGGLVLRCGSCNVF